MKISCESCATRYSIPDEKIRGKGRTFKIRCKSCGATMIVKGIDPDAAAAGAAVEEAPPPSWYYAIGTDRKGPVGPDELKELLTAGNIAAETYVWRQGMANWTHLGEVDALRALIPAQATAAEAPAGAVDDEEEEYRDTAYMSQAELMAAQQAYTADYGTEEGAEGAATEPETADVGVAAPAPQPEPAPEPAPAAAEPAGSDLDALIADAAGMGDDVRPADADAGADALIASLGGEAAPAAEEPAAPDVAAHDPAAVADPFAAAVGDDLGGFAADDDIGGSTMEGDAPVFESQPLVSDTRDDPFAATDAPQRFSLNLGEAAPAPAAQMAADDIFGATSDALDDAGVDEAAASDDIFAFGKVEDEAEQPTGIHQRRESSVLFSLDELANPSKGLTQEDLLTESSGLIDIRAAARTTSPSGPDNPFADVGAAGLVTPQRPGFTAIAVPIVRQKKSKLPLIAVAAVVLLIGGGLAVYFATRGGDEPGGGPQAAVVKDDQSQVKKDGPTDKPTADKPIADKPATDQPATDPSATDKPAGDGAQVAAAGGTPGDGTTPTNTAGVGATAPVNPAAAGTPPGDGTQAGTPAEAKPGETTPGDPKPAEAGAVTPKPKPKPRPKRDPKPKPKDPKPKDPAPRVDKKPDPPKPPKENKENSADVTNLLKHLNKSGPDPGATPGGDSTLPKRLSAPVVKRVLRAKRGAFRDCYRLQKNPPPGAVTVRTSFVIGSTGRVKTARVTSSGGTSGDVQGCIVRVLKGLKFDKFRDAQQAVTYPIRLQ